MHDMCRTCERDSLECLDCIYFDPFSEDDYVEESQEGSQENEVIWEWESKGQ